MPGKVNPVIAEALCQAAAQVIGNDATIAIGGISGNFELNVMMPVMAYNLLQSISLLTNAISVFTKKCISGIRANKERCEEMIEKSLAMCTALSPYIGYDKAAQLAKEAFENERTIREIAKEKRVLPENELEKILDPWSMIKPPRLIIIFSGLAGRWPYWPRPRSCASSILRRSSSGSRHSPCGWKCSAVF